MAFHISPTDWNSALCSFDFICLVVVTFPSFARILGECWTIHSPPALFFFFFEEEIRSRTLIPLFRPGSVHSGSAS